MEKSLVKVLYKIDGGPNDEKFFDNIIRDTLAPVFKKANFDIEYVGHERILLFNYLKCIEDGTIDVTPTNLVLIFKLRVIDLHFLLCTLISVNLFFHVSGTKFGDYIAAFSPDIDTLSQLLSAGTGFSYEHCKKQLKDTSLTMGLDYYDYVEALRKIGEMKK